MNFEKAYERITNLNIKAGDRIRVEIDQDIYQDHIIYVDFNILKCDLLNGIQSKDVKVAEIELVNELSDSYGQVIELDIIKKILNIKNGNLSLNKISHINQKL
jgi:hypothetical protein